jgi:predicted transposase YbfD/YdcC
VGKRSGRTERRTLRTTTRLNDYLDWPDVGQVCQLERVIRCQGEQKREVAYAISSVEVEEANAQTMLDWWRGHWGIENRLHWVRDVTMGEDASRVRCDNAPEVLAALRNAAIAVLRLAGSSNIAEALRENAFRGATFVLPKLGIVNF